VKAFLCEMVIVREHVREAFAAHHLHGHTVRQAIGLVGPRLFGRVGQSKQAAAKAQIELFGAALDQYRLDLGAYPAAGAGLQALVQNPSAAAWNGPYLKKPTVPADPWGRPYQYKCCPGDHSDYDIWTYGADGAPGGEGENTDVTSWDVK